MKSWSINGAMGSDRWVHGAFRHHNVDQSRFHLGLASHACSVNVSCGLVVVVVDDALQMVWSQICWLGLFWWSKGGLRVLWNRLWWWFVWYWYSWTWNQIIDETTRRGERAKEQWTSFEIVSRPWWKRRRRRRASRGSMEQWNEEETQRKLRLSRWRL